MELKLIPTSIIKGVLKGVESPLNPRTDGGRISPSEVFPDSVKTVPLSAAKFGMTSDIHCVHFPKSLTPYM